MMTETEQNLRAGNLTAAEIQHELQILLGLCQQSASMSAGFVIFLTACRCCQMLQTLCEICCLSATKN